MTSTQPFSAVLRLGGVTISKELLEERLGVKLDRFQLQRSGDVHFAQFNFPDDGCLYETITETLQKIGPPILELISEAAIGSPSLDLAFRFAENSFTHSVRLPSSVADVAGRYRIDIEVSNYPISE